MALMMVFSEFLFAPFGNDLISHSVDVFLKILDENDFVPSFPNLFNFVAKDIFIGLAYLHETILSTETLSQAIYLLVTPITAVKSQQNEKSYLQSNQLYAKLLI